MASNFKIFCRQKGDSLHIKIAGDFDGSSAFELVNTLNEHHAHIKNIFIQTCGLASIHPFGMRVFQKHCKLNRLSGRVTFTGKYRNEMA